jgi:hypothetical protein
VSMKPWVQTPVPPKKKKKRRASPWKTSVCDWGSSYLAAVSIQAWSPCASPA